jgi:hypothetical protein
MTDREAEYWDDYYTQNTIMPDLSKPGYFAIMVPGTKFYLIFFPVIEQWFYLSERKDGNC